jgi:hypothetical protein
VKLPRSRNPSLSSRSSAASTRGAGSPESPASATAVVGPVLSSRPRQISASATSGSGASALRREAGVWITGSIVASGKTASTSSRRSAATQSAPDPPAPRRTVARRFSMRWLSHSVQDA